MTIAEAETPTDGAPKPENIAGIDLWNEFEKLDDETKRAVFTALVESMYHSSASGLSVEQVEERKELFTRLLAQTEKAEEDLKRPPRDESFIHPDEY